MNRENDRRAYTRCLPEFMHACRKDTFYWRHALVRLCLMAASPSASRLHVTGLLAR